MVRPPRFWYRPPGLLALALWPAGALYAIGAGIRHGIVTPRRVAMPVICVGNPTLGGAGKTPVAMAIAQTLTTAGYTPHFLTRGFGGLLKGPVRVDTAVHSAADVGDEPLLLARCAPTHVSRNRVAGATEAVEQGADVIVMDDGFQNPTLHKDISFLVIDGGAGVGNGQVFPAGPLRAPLDGQMARADAVVVVGSGANGDKVARDANAAGIPVLAARLQPDTGALLLRNTRLLAFCGIGRPQKFHETLKGLGAEIVSNLVFADHHPYHPADIDKITALARQHRIDVIVTTEKDYVRFDENNDPEGRFRARLQTVSVSLKFDDPDRLAALLTEKLPAFPRPGTKTQDAPLRSR